MARPAHLRATVALALAVVSVAAVAALGPAVTRGPQPAQAAVVHVDGFRATVAGWPSWYGSYDLAALGPGWCIDHGIAAPDPDLAYEAVALDEVTAPVRGAMAWAVGRHGVGADAVGSAALMLVLHDLVDAPYPRGVLDVDTLGIDELGGFDGAEAAVLERARVIKADALAHGSLQGPYRLTVAATAVAPGATGTLRVSLADGAGLPVAGVGVDISATGASPAASTGTTDAAGEVTAPFTAGEGENRFDVLALLPDPSLHAFAPTGGTAQRVAVPARVEVRGAAAFTAHRTGRIVVRKTGDATPFLPIAGARFGIAPLEGDHEDPPPVEITVGAGGTAEPVDVAPGRYLVREIEPPAGYEPLDPWTVDVVAGETLTVEVVNRARRGRVTVRKVDPNGAALAGAVFRLDQDADLDGTYETAGEERPAAGPVTFDDLLPGRYLLVERSAPPGYSIADPRAVVVGPGAALDVVVVDQPLAPTTTSTPPLPTTTTTMSPSPPTVPAPTTTQPTPSTSSTTTTSTSMHAPPPTPVSPRVQQRLPATGLPLVAVVAVGVALVIGGRVLQRAARR